jgi:ABC-2 type transport system permease protein
MARGFLTLTWLELKIFVREPLGLIASLGVPVLIYVLMGRAVGPDERPAAGGALDAASAAAGSPFNVAVFGAIIIAVSAVLSLIAVVAIYREGGILKRLRATPLSPVTILGAQVAVKLAITVASLGLLVLAGRRFLPDSDLPPLLPFGAALVLGTLAILAFGFVVASLVPTARFAQPLGAALLYPMVAVSGLFFPVDRLPRALEAIAWALPTTHAVALMQGVWDGRPWAALWPSVAALVGLTALLLVVAARIFRWE